MEIVVFENSDAVAAQKFALRDYYDWVAQKKQRLRESTGAR
jgi:hypothetical protein